MRAIASDGNDSIDAQLFGIGQNVRGDVADHLLTIFQRLVLKWITAVGCAQNGSTARQDAAHMLERQFEGFFRPD